MSEDYDAIDSAACAISTSGAAWCWGSGDSGRLGNGADVDSPSPVLVNDNHEWRMISGGNNHFCGVTTSNAGYCWGDNLNSKLGVTNDAIDRNTPGLVTGSYSWEEIHAGYFTTCGLTTGNIGYCWGNAWSGGRGDGAVVGSTYLSLLAITRTL